MVLTLRRTENSLLHVSARMEVSQHDLVPQGPTGYIAIK